VLEVLGDQFTLGELEAALAKMRREQRSRRREWEPVAAAIMALILAVLGLQLVESLGRVTAAAPQYAAALLNTRTRDRILRRSGAQLRVRLPLGRVAVVDWLRSDGARRVYEATLDYEDNPYLFGAHLKKWARHEGRWIIGRQLSTFGFFTHKRCWHASSPGRRPWISCVSSVPCRTRARSCCPHTARPSRA
jgi:hypothetical protein